MRTVYAPLVFLLVFVSLVGEAKLGVSVDTSLALLITVDQSGKGDFQTIQDAIDAVTSHNSEQVFILIKPGIYRLHLSLSLSLVSNKVIFIVLLPFLYFIFLYFLFSKIL
ncbi:putative pectinesterase [Dioscorea sansibarensis]